MQQILVSCEEPFRSHLQKNEPVQLLLFLKLLLNGASHDTKIGCIRLVWAGAKTYKFSFLRCAGPLRRQGI